MVPIAIVPAAGKGARFGGAKLLADVGGEPMLNRTIRSLLDAGIGRVVVVVSPHALLPVPLLADRRVQTTPNPDPERGMFSSIQAGLSGVVGDPILVLPGDMPFVRADTIAAVIDAARETGLAVSPRHGGRRGHPVALPGRLRASILAAPAESTLKDILATLGDDRIEIDVDDAGIVRDVDERKDLKS